MNLRPGSFQNKNKDSLHKQNRRIWVYWTAWVMWFSWVIFVGHFRGWNSFIILVGETRGSFSWAKLVGHCYWLFLCLELLLQGDTLRSPNCPAILARLWILSTCSQNSNIYNLLFPYFHIFLFSSAILGFYPP